MWVKKYYYKMLADEISRSSRYFEQIIQVDPVSGDQGDILNYIECPIKKTMNLKEFKDHHNEHLKIPYLSVFLNGNLNHSLDIESFLKAVFNNLNRTGRIFIVVYNPYLKFIYRILSFLKLRNSPAPDTMFTYKDLKSFEKLCSFETVRKRGCFLVPFNFLGLGKLLHKISLLFPFLSVFSFSSIFMLRPIKQNEKKPSLSIIIPARNESGNIKNAVDRLVQSKISDFEVIFVEGNSTDTTWEDIQKIEKSQSYEFNIKSFQQKGRGKADAVRLGISKAQNELVTILDADLTVPPEKIEFIYQSFVEGHGDFINGNRLLYPYEKEAMRFLNRIGNIFFAKFLTYVLQLEISDSLCGTKLFLRSDYLRFEQWKKDFGDFDPFGDFELLFPAAQLGIGIFNFPVHYKARTYGETQIQRFRNGLELLQMSLIGLFKIRL